MNGVSWISTTKRHVSALPFPTEPAGIWIHDDVKGMPSNGALNSKPKSRFFHHTWHVDCNFKSTVPGHTKYKKEMSSVRLYAADRVMNEAKTCLSMYVAEIYQTAQISPSNTYKNIKLCTPPILPCDDSARTKQRLAGK